MEKKTTRQSGLSTSRTQNSLKSEGSHTTHGAGTVKDTTKSPSRGTTKGTSSTMKPKASSTSTGTKSRGTTTASSRTKNKEY